MTRALVVLLLALGVPHVGTAQQPGKVYRISSIATELTTIPPGQGPFWDRMRELGWVYGQNVVIERRASGADSDRIPGIARELIALGTDVFLANNGTTVARILRETRTIPIVATTAGDLVAAGFAASVARPGGTVTGVQVMQTELAGKHLSLLKEAIPGLSRVGVLAGDEGFSEAKMGSRNSTAAWIHEINARAPTLGLQLHVAIASDGAEVERAFSAFKSHRSQAIVLYGSTLMYASRATIAALALTQRLPTICLDSNLIPAGYLMSYGWDRQASLRLVADFVDKILRGTKPGDIPIQQPTTFRFVINLRTAKALGLTLPPSLLARADEVVH
jgi:putative ABC transport system substrate-binding protein